MSITINPYTNLFARTYKLGRTLIDSACTIQGKGIDVTIIEMTEDVLFDIVMDTDGHVTIKDLTIVLNEGSVKSAIRYDGSTQADHHPSVSLIADRLSPRMTLQNVNIEAKGSATFENAIHVINGLGINMFNCSLNQANNVRIGTAIRIEGQYQPVAFNIGSSRILNFRVGIYSQDAEGLKIFNNNIVANSIGVQVNHLTHQPEVNISGNHISSDLHNVWLKNVNNAHIGGGNLLFRREGGLSVAESSSVFMQNCRNSILLGNIFTSNWNHIHTRNCENITIGANNHKEGDVVKHYDDSDKFSINI